jgi:Superinfection immunity protein
MDNDGRNMSSFIGFAVIIMLITLAAGVYLLPTIIALVRHAPCVAGVAVINMLLGWSFVGWLVALAMAVSRPASPPVQVIGQMNIRGEVPCGSRAHSPL